MFCNRFHFSILIIFLTVTFLIVTVSSKAAQHQFITLLDPEAKEIEPPTAVKWNLETTESGLKSVLETAFEKLPESSEIPGPVGWELLIEIDGFVVLQEVHSLEDTKFDQLLPLTEIPDGLHTIKLITRVPGGKGIEQTRKFELHAGPIIEISAPDNNRDTFDPEISLSFFGERDGIAGFVDVRLDNRILKTTEISSKQIRSVQQLSELTATEIYYADLTPGNHLFSIIAHGLNGAVSEKSQILPVTPVLPEIQIKYSDKQLLDEISIKFPLSSNMVKGDAEVRFDRSVILAKRTEQQTLKIKGEEILTALKKHNYKIGGQPLTMVLSTRSSNNVENWQKFSFKQ